MDHQERATLLLTSSCIDSPCGDHGTCACRNAIAAALQEAFDMGYKAAGGTVSPLPVLVVEDSRMSFGKPAAGHVLEVTQDGQTTRYTLDSEGRVPAFSTKPVE